MSKDIKDRAAEIVNWLSNAGAKVRREKELCEEEHKLRCEICGELFLGSKGMVSSIHCLCPIHLMAKARIENGSISFVDFPVITERCYVCGEPLGLGSDGRPHCGWCNWDYEECRTPEAMNLWKAKLQEEKEDVI